MFRNPVVGFDGVLIRERMRSENYVAGVSGWTISQDGVCEFNSVTVRGDIVADTFATDVSPNSRITVETGEANKLRLYTNATDGFFITSSDLFGGDVQGFFQVFPFSPAYGSAYISMYVDPTDTFEASIQLGFIDGPSAGPIIELKNDSIYCQPNDSFTITLGLNERFVVNTTNFLFRDLPGSAVAGADVRYNTTTDVLYYLLSNAAYKENVRTQTVDWARQLLRTRVHQYDPIDAITDFQRDVSGWIAEELDTDFPDAVLRNEAGEPTGVDTHTIIAALTLLVQDLYRRIDDQAQAQES